MYGDKRDITPDERILLTNLRRMPDGYLGARAGLHELHTFLHGYEVAVMRHGLRDVRVLPADFEDYARTRMLGSVRTDAPWWALLAEREPDNERALALFWELLDACLEAQGLPGIPAPDAPPEPEPFPDGLYPVQAPQLPELAASYRRTFNGAPWWDRWDSRSALLRLNDLYRTPGFAGWALWKDGLPQACVLGRSERYYDGDCFQIVEFWVDPGVQRRGLGRLLMEALRRQLARRKIVRIYLITSPGDATAGFYRKSGFLLQDGLCVMQLGQEEM